MTGRVYSFLFTDIEGSTRRWATEPGQMAQALEQHDEMLARIIGASRGYVFKTVGDAVCAVFESPDDALQAALQIQRQVRKHDWPTASPIRVRSAVHAGTAISRGRDFFGPTLNLVARLLAKTHPGQILASEAIRILLSTANLATWSDLGRQFLKDIPEPISVWSVQPNELSETFPPFPSTDERPTNLHAVGNSFHGRVDESRQVAAALATHRVVILTGAGGSGKTRLAQETARVSEGFADGVWFVALSSATDDSAVLARIADTLHLPLVPNDSLGVRILEKLRRHSCLIVLDNCEHLLVSTHSLIRDVHDACPDVKVLATSRTPLGLPMERCIAVPPLPIPRSNADMSDITENPAVQLFVSRAQSLEPSFHLRAEDCEAVLTICRRLSGIPLAIELVAARVASLPVSRIAERLDDRMLGIQNLDPTTEQRQQTLADAIRWSYDLLPRSAASLLQRLSVFAGGFTIQAAESVCQASSSESDIEDDLTTLVRASLLVFDREQSRYGFLEPIREFSLAQLRADGHESEYRDRHLVWARDLAHEAEPHLQQADSHRWISILDLEHENLRAALRWATSASDRLSIAASLHRYWRMRGLHHEGIGWMSTVIHRSDGVEPALQAKSANSLGILLWSEGRFDEAAELLQRAVDLYRALGNRQRMAGAMANLGNVLSDLGSFSESESFHRQAIDVYRDLRDDTNLTRELANLACCLFDSGQSEAAEAIFLEVRDRQSKTEDPSGLATTLGNLAIITSAKGNSAAAKQSLVEAIECALAADDHHLSVWLLLPLAATAHLSGDTKLTERSLKVRADECRRHDITFGVYDRSLQERLERETAAQMDQSAQDSETETNVEGLLRHALSWLNSE